MGIEYKEVTTMMAELEVTMSYIHRSNSARIRNDICEYMDASFISAHIETWGSSELVIQAKIVTMYSPRDVLKSVTGYLRQYHSALLGQTTISLKPTWFKVKFVGA